MLGIHLGLVAQIILGLTMSLRRQLQVLLSICQLLYQIHYYFLLEKCENLCRRFSHFFSTKNNCIFLAHLSRRLIDELIVYQGSGVRRRRPQCSSIFFSETAWPIKAKFYVELPWVGGTKFCSRHLGHMTKMAATPIYGKNPSKSSSPEPAGRFSRNLVCSIGDSSPL